MSRLDADTYGQHAAYPRGKYAIRGKTTVNLDLSERERRSFSERHALSTDGDGNEVLVGLTRDESLALLGHIRMNSLPVRASGIRQEKDVQKRGIELREKHETARLKAQWAAQGYKE